MRVDSAISDGSAGRLLAAYFQEHSPLLSGQSLERLQCVAIRLAGNGQESLQSGQWDASGELIGIAQLSPLAFDSQHYGKPMGRVDYVVTASDNHTVAQTLIHLLLQNAREARLQHLHFRVPAAAHHVVLAAQREGFRLVSGNVHFARSLDGLAPPPSSLDVEICFGTSDDALPLRLLSREAFSGGTRFHLDPYLEVEVASPVHEAWVQNCLKGEAADIVLVARVDGQMAGFVTVQRQQPLMELLDIRIGEIGLFAVSREYQRRGIGQMLLAAGLGWCREQGLATAIVDTEQVNVAATNSYIKSGFAVSHMSYSFSYRPQE